MKTVYGTRKIRENGSSGQPRTAVHIAMTMTLLRSYASARPAKSAFNCSQFFADAGKVGILNQTSRTQSRMSNNIGGGKSKRSLVLRRFGLFRSGLIPGLLLFWAFLTARAQTGGETVGIPWTGSAGVTQTVAEIMAQDRNLPVQSSLQPRQSDEGQLVPNR